MTKDEELLQFSTKPTTTPQASQSFTQNQETAREAQHKQPTKPKIAPKPTPEQVKIGAARFFLISNNMNPKELGFEDFSHYISSTKNARNPNLVDKVINPYKLVLKKIIGELNINKKEKEKEKFMNLVEDLLEGHSHKDKFDKINQLHKDIPKTEFKEQDHSHKPEEGTHKGYKSNTDNHSQKSSHKFEEGTHKSSDSKKFFDIIDKLQELSNNDDIIANLKQSRKHVEFRKLVKDIIETYDRKVPENSGQKSIIFPMLEAKLKKLNEWCEKTSETDDVPFWRNIGNYIKYSLTGDEKKAALYKEAIRNSTQNTREAIAKIQKSLINSSSHSSNVPPQNTTQRGRSKG